MLAQRRRLSVWLEFIVGRASGHPVVWPMTEDSIVLCQATSDAFVSVDRLSLAPVRRIPAKAQREWRAGSVSFRRESMRLHSAGFFTMALPSGLRVPESRVSPGFFPAINGAMLSVDADSTP